MTPLDDVTFNRVRRSLRRARNGGLSVAETLHHDGLLWTPAREREVRAAALRFILLEMRTWRPAEFLRSVNKAIESATPEDMYRSIYKWIEDHVTHAQKENT